MLGVTRHLSVWFAMGDEPTVWTFLALLRTQEAGRHHHICRKKRDRKQETGGKAQVTADDCGRGDVYTPHAQGGSVQQQLSSSPTGHCSLYWK